VKRAILMACLAASMVCGCDRFDGPGPAPSVKADEARAAAKEQTAAILKAAQAATASCVAGELRWEPDDTAALVSRHYSRPCIPERCATTAADIESLRKATASLKALLDREASLRVPSFQGFVAIAEAMVGFADTALAGSKDKAAQLSGLSFHYSALATAYRDLWNDNEVPTEPPSLTKSLDVPEPGGDPCKAWAKPQTCDVRGVRVPKERRWRVNPPCIEVEGIRK
jgi:hypothetical protein